jgi:hypothetical protein
MKYKVGMILCAYIIILISIVYDILRFIILTIFLPILIFLKFNYFSFLINNFTKNIDEFYKKYE